MNNNEYNRYVDEREYHASLAYSSLLRKVYVWMTLALVITGITAYGVAHSPRLLEMIVTTPLLFYGAIIGEFLLVVGVSAAINRLSLTTATLLFLLYSVLNGVTFSFIFIAYTSAVIAKVFFITAGTFAAMALFGHNTRMNLSSVGRFGFMLLIGVIIASVVNIFLKSTMIDYILSYVGVITFVGLTAWDAQKIRQMLQDAETMDESTQKIALVGALTLYLDFINLFVYLLRIFGRER